jgi:hypothetical protein
MKDSEAFRPVNAKVQEMFSDPLDQIIEEALLAADRVKELPPPELMHFQYVLVHIRESEPDKITMLLARVVDAFLIHQATPADTTPSLLVGYFGFPNAKYDSIEARINLVAALLAENGTAVRIAHGQCNGLGGFFGSQRRGIYGAVIPIFSAVLKKLLDIEFGTAVEIS